MCFIYSGLDSKPVHVCLERCLSVRGQPLECCSVRPLTNHMDLAKHHRTCSATELCAQWPSASVSESRFTLSGELSFWLTSNSIAEQLRSRVRTGPAASVY